MKILKKSFIALAGIILAFGCNKELDNLTKRVDTLESQVKMLETAVAALNDNVIALQKFAGGATINSVELKEGVYTIKLTNGDVLTVRQGSIGVGKAPIMTIDEDGYWLADYQDGKGPQNITDADGEKVRALGDDGVTPQFSVDENDYWTVSYDDGLTWAQVKDALGNPVKAFSDLQSDSYFKDVKVENGYFLLTLKNGTTYRVPIAEDFLCEIVATGIQTFNSGETKTYTVNTKGVASTLVTAPAGWDASFDGSVLSVTAPTKAAIADLASDVSILAISSQNKATVAKISVTLN